MWKINEIEILDLEITSYCGLKCPGCFRQQVPSANSLFNKDIMSLDDIKYWFEKIDFPSIRTINFCGSIDEPISHPDLLGIIDYFSTWNVYLHIATSGSVRNSRFWYKLGQILKEKFPNHHSVTFGIDGIDKETSERYRVNSNYDKVVDNYKSFIKAGGQANWQFIVFDYNEDQIEAARKRSSEEGFKKFRLIYSHRNTNGEKQIQRDTQTYIVCKYGNQKRLFINHRGNVLPCCHMNSETMQYISLQNIDTDYQQLYSYHGGEAVTNLKYNHISNIIKGPLFNDIIKSWSTPTPIKRCNQICRQNKQDIFVDARFNNNKNI